MFIGSYNTGCRGSILAIPGIDLFVVVFVSQYYQVLTQLNMINMEFMDADYSVLLENAEKNLEAEGEKEAELKKPNSTRPEETARWSFSYCQQLFDVTTAEVVARMAQSFKALNSHFLTEDLLDKPDLYGPIWICVTLALELGLTSDLVHYLEFYTERPWRSSVNTVYRASVMLFLYSWCLPTVIWIALEWNAVSEVKYKLLDLLCVYGYSNAVCLPAVALWTVPLPWLRWASGLTASVVSGLMICRSLKKAFVKLDAGGYYTVQILLFVLNALIGICFNVCFFPSHPHPGAALHNATLIQALHHNESSNATPSLTQIIMNQNKTEFNHLNTTNLQF